jgi:Tetratricopeptide repeat
VATEDPASFDDQPTELRTRRAAVLAGVGLVWAAFTASIGVLPVALLVLLCTAGGAAWMLGVRVPRRDVRPAARQGRAWTARSARQAWSSSGRFLVRAREAVGSSGSAALTRLGSTGRATGQRLSATASVAKKSVPKPRLPAAPSGRRRSDPRVERALVFNSEGIALAKAGKHAEAIDAFDTALALLAETGDRHHEGQVLANLGVVHRSVGGTEAARFCWTRALERLDPGTRESERTAELLGVR